MSFDPITLALAKKYTDEKAGGGGSGASQKMIDLTKYAARHDDYGIVSFNDFVLDLFSRGGGSVPVDDDSTFWNDVATDSPIKFVIDAGALTLGLKVETETNSVTKLGDLPIVIEFSFLVKSDLWGKVTVVFGLEGDVGAEYTRITVVVEPLTIPDA